MSENTTAVTEITTNSCETFDARINTWAEGTLMSIDADTSKLTIRGAVRPYASEYAKMLKKIHDTTEKMTQTDRAGKAADIRAEWTTALDLARATETQKDSDFTFHLPGKDGKLVIVDETPFYNRDLKTVTAAAQLANLTDKECKAIRALKDLQVGACVVVGYESGMIRNDAYVVIKANECVSK
jgi:hypothetical protein